MLEIAPYDDIATVRALFLEYAESLGVDLSFQNFEDEVASLPGDYDPILIGRWNGEVAGCVAMHPFEERICEMKRLYVRPSFRAHGIARSLAEALIAIARERGFRAMRLDTLPMMRPAMALYESLGFADIDPYRFNPIAGSRYMELRLSSSS
jgi:ribosomal protein S18 acetylase RimI-like enzyme